MTHLLEKMLDLGEVFLEQALLALHQEPHELFLCTGKHNSVNLAAVL